MTQSSDRLDRIESNIEQITIVIGQLGSLIRGSHEQISLLAERLDSIANLALEAQQRSADAHQEAAIATNLALESQRQCQRILDFLEDRYSGNGQGGN